jgi:carbon-monoxide dehydrogenase large subunit
VPASTWPPNHLPDIELEFFWLPCLLNSLAMKGAGEAGAIGSPPAVKNAIVDALTPVGVTHVDMPAIPERLCRSRARARAA